MKQVHLIIFWLSVLLIAMGFSSVEASTYSTGKHRSKIRLLCNDFPCPPIILGEGAGIDWKKPGSTLELLQLVARNLNIEFEFKRVPWKRGLVLIEHNQADGIFHSSYKKERLKIGVYPMQDNEPNPDKRLLNMSYVLYKLKESPLIWDGEKFDHLNGPIGATIGFAVIDMLKEKGASVDESKRTSHNMMKLLVGRLAAVAELETMADAFLAGDPDKFKDVVKILPPLRTKPYYLMFSHEFVKKNPRLAEKIWDEIEKIRESPEFKRLFIKYAE